MLCWYHFRLRNTNKDWQQTNMVSCLHLLGGSTGHLWWSVVSCCSLEINTASSTKPADTARPWRAAYYKLMVENIFVSFRKKSPKNDKRKTRKDTQIDEYVWIQPESPAFLPWWKMWWFYVILTCKDFSGLWLIFSSMSNICADFQSGMNMWITILTAWMHFLHLVISTIATGRQSPPTGGPVRAGD